MALGNMFIKDIDVNILINAHASNERITGLIFDVSLQPTLFTEGYGKQVKQWFDNQSTHDYVDVLAHVRGLESIG